jgi:LuxR family maltose regulon positive regulatory protein
MQSLSNSFLTRRNILEYCKPYVEGNQRLIIFKAGAGFGKSVVARQVAERAKRHVAPVLCTALDRNPAQLAHKIFKAIESFQPGMEANHFVHPILTSGTPEEALLAAKDSLPVIFTKVEPVPLTILIDDAHVLLDSQAMQMLRLFYDLTPEKYAFLITTRKLLAISEKPIFSLFEGMRVGQSQLEFDKLEILYLYNEHYGLELTSGQADILLEATEGGWPAGVVLLRSEARKLSKGFKLKASDEIHQYFIQECLKGLQDSTLEHLVLLGQLEDISADMLNDLGLQDTAETLLFLCRSGLFTTSYHLNGSIYYRFHHLFKQTLRSLIAGLFSGNQIKQFNHRICGWLEDHGCIEESLLLWSLCKDWHMIAQFMRKHGPKLLAQNKLGVIEQGLRDCPEDILLKDEWLAGIYGFSTLFSYTAGAVKLLEHAFQLANKNHDDKAELISGLGLLNYLLLLNADLWRMRDVSQRVAHLVEHLLRKDVEEFELAKPCALLLPPTIAYSNSDYDLSIRCTDLLKRHWPKLGKP